MSYERNIPTLKTLAIESALEQGLTNVNARNQGITSDDMSENVSLSNFDNVRYTNTNVHSSDSLYNKLKIIMEKQSLKYILDFLNRNPDINNAKFSDCAAETGNIDVLEWLNENGSIPDEKTFRIVAKYGHLNTLKWLLDNNCHWDTRVCAYASAGGQLECLKWLRENGCPWDYQTTGNAAYFAHFDCLKWSCENGCDVVNEDYMDYLLFDSTRGGSIECLDYIYTHIYNSNVNWTNHHRLLCVNTIIAGCLECLKYLHDINCPWSEQTCIQAIRSNRIDCLDYALQNNCPSGQYLCTTAANEKNMNCLVLARHYNCHWDEQTCYTAAQKGYIDILRYLHENECPWNSSTISYAATFGHSECLEYALNNGCTIERNECTRKITQLERIITNYEQMNDVDNTKENYIECLDILRNYLNFSGGSNYSYYKKNNEISTTLLSITMLIIIFGVSILQTI